MFMTRLTRHRPVQHVNSAGILVVAEFSHYRNLTPRPLGLRHRSSGRAGGPCSGGPQDRPVESLVDGFLFGSFLPSLSVLFLDIAGVVASFPNPFVYLFKLV